MVHGIAGIGKTCMMNHIAQSWAKKDPSLQRFKYILLLHARKIRNHSETAERVICHDLKLLPEKLSVNIKLLLKFDSKRFLILIDGYNELSDEQRDDNNTLLNKIIYRRVAGEAVVIVTTRPETKPYIEKLTNGNYIDLPLKKLDQVGMFTFISNFFPGCDKNKEFHKVSKALMLEQHSEIPEDVTSVPLFLTMLCYLCKTEIEKTGDVELFKELTELTIGSIVATCWTLLINVKQKKKKIIETILKVISVEYVSYKTMQMIYALAKMCFNRVENGETVFSNDVLRENELDMDCVYELGPVEIDRGRMVFFHAIFQEYAAAVHITRDDTALDIVLRAYKSRQDNPALFEKYRQALVMAAGIRPAILDTIRTVDFGITLFITEEPEYRLDLSIECDLVHACSIHDDDETKVIIKRFVSHIIDAPVTKKILSKELPELNRRPYQCLLGLMEHSDCYKLIKKVHIMIKNAAEDIDVDNEACTPRISPLSGGGTYQAIRDPILLAALPYVDLG